MFIEVLLAASTLASPNYDELRTKAIAEENFFDQEQRASWYSLKMRLFNEALTPCLNEQMRPRAIEFKAVAVIEQGRIKNVVIGTESRDTKCIARQLKGDKFPPVEKIPEHVLFEMTFTPA